MPDPIDNNPNPNNPPPGSEPSKPAGDGNVQVTPDALKTLSSDQLAAVLENPNFWKLPRVTQLKEKASKVETYEEEQRKKEEQEALKRGEHEKIISTKDQRIKELEESISNSRIDNAITLTAIKLGAIDANAVIKLIDKSGVKVNDDGTVSGVDEAVTKLFETSPYLKGEKPAEPVGAPSNPGGSNPGQKTFKKSQIDDPVFYRENEKEILKAWKLGLIEDDTAPAPNQ